MNEFVILGLVAIVVLTILLLVTIISIQNRMVRLEKLIEDAWSNIDVLLKRRYDLIPNLVETTKAFATHEQRVLSQLVKLREQATQASSFAEIEQCERAIIFEMKGFFARSESYPELRSSAHFLHLQEELVNTEDRIAAARRFYNNNVREYNIAIETYPGNALKGERTPKPFFMMDF
jgi:LemA protein